MIIWRACNEGEIIEICEGDEVKGRIGSIILVVGSSVSCIPSEIVLTEWKF